MIDDFLFRAILAGAGVALISGPLGCQIVWRRMAYFGDTIAHSALLGVAMAYLTEVNQTIGVFVGALVVSLVLLALQKRQFLSGDTLLGILSHASLAIGLVLIALMPSARVNTMSVLFGDILSVSDLDLLIIYGTAVAVLIGLRLIWRTMLASGVSDELARAEGLPAGLASFVFMILMAAAVAVAIKVVGVLLMTALLIIPAATARRYSATPERMAIVSIGFGLVAVIFGLYGSLLFDTPSGPSIVVAAFLAFLLSQINWPWLKSSQQATL